MDKRRCHVNRVEIEGAVRKRYAFRSAGGSAGIEQLANGGFIDAEDIRSRYAAARQQVLVRLTEFDPVLDRRASGTQLFDAWREITFVNHHAWLGMIQNAAQFDGRQPDIERHDDRRSEKNA